MVKEKPRQRRPVNHTPRISPKPQPGTPSRYTDLLFLLPVLAVATVAFYPSIGNDFVNWDDIVYVMNNDMIRKVSWENITRIFSSFYMGNYHPFTLTSFMFDYQLAQLKPSAYHVHNLLLHLCNTLLVWCFFYRLLDRKRIPALLIALVFAVHPMHVESVAWISERKDLLYTFWYFLSLIAFMIYTDKRKPAWFLFSLLFFLFSLLSKAQAVTLPVVLLLVDYFARRGLSLRTAMEKIPFFLLSLFFGIIAIYAQQADNSVNPVGLTTFQSLFYGFYSIWVYLFKFIFPVSLNCLYEYPFAAGHTIPWYIWSSPVILLFLGWAIWVTWKRRPAVAFGLLFFLAAIFPVLQFLPVGTAVVAERYSYIPYAGLAMAVVVLLTEATGTRPAGYRRFIPWAGIAILALFTAGTWNRCQVWKDSVALWTDVMEKNPACVAAYVNRSYMYNQYEMPLKAVEDCDAGLKLDPANGKLYYNRGLAYRKLGENRPALRDLTAALKFDTLNSDPCLDRGIIYTDVFNQYDSGIADFRRYLRYRNNHPNGLFNLAVAFYKKGLTDSAEVWLKRSVETDPSVPSAWYLYGVIMAARKDYDKACEYGLKARNMGYPVEEGLLELWKGRQ